MSQIRTARSRTAALGQLGISITATVAATLIVTALQSTWRNDGPLPSFPAVTSGGKFAARVEALRAEPDRVATVPSPPPVPLLVADASLRAVPILLREDAAPAAAPKTVPAAAVVRPTHTERRRVAEVGIVPPRRSDNVVEVAAPVPAASDSETTRLWAATKGLYQQAVWLGGATLDRVNPMNLLP